MKRAARAAERDLARTSAHETPVRRRACTVRVRVRRSRAQDCIAHSQVMPLACKGASLACKGVHRSLAEAMPCEHRSRDQASPVCARARVCARATSGRDSRGESPTGYDSGRPVGGVLAVARQVPGPDMAKHGGSEQGNAGTVAA